jgi:hypothetical protein
LEPLQVWLLPPFPHLALVVTLSVEEAAGEVERVDEDEVTRVSVELGLRLEDEDEDALQSP